MMQRCPKPFGSEAIFEGPGELKCIGVEENLSSRYQASWLYHPLAVEDLMLASLLVPSLLGASSEPTIFEMVKVVFTLQSTMRNKCCNTVRPRKYGLFVA